MSEDAESRRSKRLRLKAAAKARRGAVSGEVEKPEPELRLVLPVEIRELEGVSDLGRAELVVTLAPVVAGAIVETGPLLGAHLEALGKARPKDDLALWAFDLVLSALSRGASDSFQRVRRGVRRLEAGRGGRSQVLLDRAVMDLHCEAFHGEWAMRTQLEGFRRARRAAPAFLGEPGPMLGHLARTLRMRADALCDRLTRTGKEPTP